MKSTLTSPVLIVTLLLIFVILSVIAIVAFLIPVQRAQGSTEFPVSIDTTPVAMNESPTQFTEAERATASAESTSSAEIQFTLKTIAEKGKLLYIGIGGDIDGVVNPDLIVQPSSTVHIILINGDGMTHDLFLPEFDVSVKYVRRIGDQSEAVFETGDMPPGSYVYYCTLPGHRKAGQEGRLIVQDFE